MSQKRSGSLRCLNGYHLVGGVTIGVEGVELEEVEPGVRVVEVEDVGELERVGCGELGGVL